jgi:protein PhnA
MECNSFNSHYRKKGAWKHGFGNKLKGGNAEQVIKTQGYVGSSSVKVGTKLKNIRLIESDHDISCKIEGFGLMQFKSEFARND